MPRKPYRLTPNGLRSLRAAIRTTRPWELSTGPATSNGKRMSSLNAFKHGCRTKLTFRLPVLVES